MAYLFCQVLFFCFVYGAFCVCYGVGFYDIINKTNQREKLASQVISVNRKRYAAGLFWQPAGAGFVARNYARTLSHSIDKKLNLYTEYRSMIGMGSGKVGHKSGMVSAAAEVVEVLSEYNSFLGVFLAGNMFYLVAVRNGVILKDELFSDSDTARKAYFELSEIPDWGAVFAPGAWGMPRAVERSLSDIITGVVRAGLRPVSRIKTGAFSFLLSALFVVAVLFVFREPIGQMLNPPAQVAKINPDLAAEYKKQIEEKNKELDEKFEIQKPLPPEPIVLPYDTLPNVAARSAVCYQAIAFLMQPVQGWNQVFAECGETHAFVNFKRDFGTLVDFYNITADVMPGAFVVPQSENSITVRVALPKVDSVASQDERDAETILRNVYSNFQLMDADIDADIAIDVLTNGVETAEINTVELSVGSKLMPMQFMEVFNEFGGVYMVHCTWNVATREWNYEVIIYAK